MCPVRCCRRGTSKIVQAWVRLPRNLASVRTPCWISGGCDDRASSWRAVETSRGRGFTATCCWEELATTDWHRQVAQPGSARAANIYFIIYICVYINSWASRVDSLRDGAFYFTIRDDPVGCCYYQFIHNVKPSFRQLLCYVCELVEPQAMNEIYKYIQINENKFQIKEFQIHMLFHDELQRLWCPGWCYIKIQR